MEYTAAVIRVEDDSVFDGGSEEVALALRALLEKDGWTIKNVSTVPSDFDRIKGELVRCSYDLGCALVLTTGGTGCSRYDMTPEATETPEKMEEEKRTERKHLWCRLTEL